MTDQDEWRAFLGKFSVPACDGALDGRKTLKIEVPTWPHAGAPGSPRRVISFLFENGKFIGIQDQPKVPSK